MREPTTSSPAEIFFDPAQVALSFATLAWTVSGIVNDQLARPPTAAFGCSPD
jgi:hypothetical protein